MGGIIHDLKAIGNDFSEGEQVLNVNQAFLNKPKYWNYVKTVLTHTEHLKTFAEIQNCLEMEEERMKIFRFPNVALIAKGNRLKGNKSSQARLL